MKPEKRKYDKIVEMLRTSKPTLNSAEEIEREVIRRIENTSSMKSGLTEMLGFLFGWVYIGWVRRSLITASIVLVMIFVYQQGMILKRIDVISRQTIVSSRESEISPSNEIERILMNYRNPLRKFPSKNTTISEKQMQELLEYVKELQLKYKDLEDLIEGDPELKSMIERKLRDINNTKSNL